MRYMLMMHAPRGTGEYQIGDWAPQDLKAHMNFMGRLNRELTEKGELVAGEGVYVKVVFNVDGKRVSDGSLDGHVSNSRRRG